MPIKPENMAKYPGGSIRSTEWLAIRDRILERDGHACKKCRAPNRVFIARAVEGDVYARAWRPDEHDGEFGYTIHCAETGEALVEIEPDYYGAPEDMGEYRDVKIVLTIAHLDHDVANNADGNLAALCQRCHNRHDQPHRQANAERTRRARLASADLFEG